MKGKEGMETKADEERMARDRKRMINFGVTIERSK